MPILFSGAVWVGSALVGSFKEEILRRLDDQTAAIKDLGGMVREQSHNIGTLQASDAAQDAEIRVLLREADKLVEEHNYELAKQRLEAFKGRNDPAVNSHWQDSLDRIDKAKQEYTAWLTGQIRLLAARKDLAELKLLREGLPQAWLGTPQEQELAQAIETVDAERLAASNAVATQAGKLLAAWNFTGLADFARSLPRKSLEGTPAAARVDACVDAAKKLTAFTEILGQRIRTAQNIRYPGVIGGFTAPDLVGGNLVNGLEIKDASGGAVYLRWSRLTPKELQSLAALVLKAEAEPYQSAITLLETAGK